MRNKYLLIVGIVVAIIAALFFNISIVDAQCAFPSADGLCGQGTPFGNGGHGTLTVIFIIILFFVWLGETNGE